MYLWTRWSFWTSHIELAFPCFCLYKMPAASCVKGEGEYRYPPRFSFRFAPWVRFLLMSLGPLKLVETWFYLKWKRRVMVIVYDYHYNAYCFLCCKMVASNFSRNSAFHPKKIYVCCGFDLENFIWNALNDLMRRSSFKTNFKKIFWLLRSNIFPEK